MKKERIKYYACAVLAVIAGIVFDQYTKFLAVEHLKGQQPFVLIKNVFELNYLENRGAAFGMLQNQKAFFIFSFVLIIAAVLYLYVKLPLENVFCLCTFVVYSLSQGR